MTTQKLEAKFKNLKARLEATRKEAAVREKHSKEISKTRITKIEDQLAAIGGKLKAYKTVSTVVPVALRGKISKVDRIDQLWAMKPMTKDRPQEILATIVKEYPNCKADSTLNTIRCRPWHMRQRGINIGTPHVAKKADAPVLQSA